MRDGQHGEPNAGRATPVPWLESGITHPYPNLPIRGRRSSPSFPPVGREWSARNWSETTRAGRASSCFIRGDILHLAAQEDRVGGQQVRRHRQQYERSSHDSSRKRRTLPVAGVIDPLAELVKCGRPVTP